MRKREKIIEKVIRQNRKKLPFVQILSVIRSVDTDDRYII